MRLRMSGAAPLLLLYAFMLCNFLYPSCNKLCSYDGDWPLLSSGQWHQSDLICYK